MSGFTSWKVTKNLSVLDFALYFWTRKTVALFYWLLFLRRGSVVNVPNDNKRYIKN